MIKYILSTSSRQLNEKIKRLQISISFKTKICNKARQHAVDFCFDNDVSNLGFSGGLSSNEEQEINNTLADNYERWAGFSLVFAFVSDEVMCGLVDFSLFKNLKVFIRSLKLNNL